MQQHSHGFACLSVFILLHRFQFICKDAVTRVWKRCYEVINSADRFQARVQVCFIPCFSKTTCTAACMSVHFINIQTASVSVYTSACCYWVSLAGSLLALDQHPKATCRCFEASGQQAPHLRSMEARGSKWKPQTLTNTWAGVTFTGLFTKT